MEVNVVYRQRRLSTGCSGKGGSRIFGEWGENQWCKGHGSAGNGDDGSD